MADPFTRFYARLHIQVLDQTGTPVAFEDHTIHAAYPNNNAVNISLQARYLQTGPNVTPGDVRATMKVLYQYR